VFANTDRCAPRGAWISETLVGIDLSTVHHVVDVLINKLRHRLNAPFAELVRLSRTSIADGMREEHCRSRARRMIDGSVRREAAGRQCRPSCTISHNQCVTTETTKRPSAVPPITTTEPSRLCRKRKGLGCDGSRFGGSSIQRPQSSSASRLTAAIRFDFCV